MPARYDAFISYSHSEDARLAPALQAALHKFAKPWWSRRAVHVFRDETNLIANPDLFGTIIEALDASEHFILLASPKCVMSDWVGRELRHWIERKGSASLLIVVTDGDIVWDDASGDFDWSLTTALPAAVKGVFQSEPLWLDLRWTKSAESFSARDPRFLDAVARLSATLRNVSLDEIAGEEVRQHRRTRTIAMSAIAAIFVFALAALVAAWLAYEGQKEAVRQAAEARRQFGVALDAVDTLITDVAQPLHDTVGVPIEVIEKILKRTEGVLDQLEKSDNVPEIVLRRARLLFVFARVYHRLGLLDESAQRARKAVASLEKHASRPDADTEFRLMLSMAQNLVGDAEMDRFGYGEASATYRRAFEIRKRLRDENPSNAEFAGHLAASYLRLGDLARGKDNPDDAVRNYQAAMGLYEIITEANDDAVWKRRKAYALRHLGLALSMSKRWDEANDALDRANDLINAILRDKKHQAIWRLDLSLISNLKGNAYLAQNQLTDAIAAHKSAIAIQQELLRKDKENRLWQHNLALSKFDLAAALMRGECFGDALVLLDEAREQLSLLATENPRHFKIRYDLYRVEYRAADDLALSGNKNEARDAYRRAAGHLTTLLEANTDNTLLRVAYDELKQSMTQLENGDASPATGVAELTEAANYAIGSVIECH